MNAPETLSRSIFMVMLGLIIPLGACEDGGGASGVGGKDSAGSGSMASLGSEGSGEGSSGSSPASSALRVVAKFDAMKNEVPEGLAITADGKTAYVGYALTGQIVKVSLPEGQVTALGGFSPPLMNGAQMLGLILDTRGDLFAAVTGAPKAGAGIYKIDQNNGAATLFIDDPKMSSPRAFSFLADGSLLVTDSIAGMIFRIDLKAQKIADWLSDPLLVGNPSPMTNKCAEGLPAFPIGASGIASFGDKVYVVNTDSGTLFQIPVNAGGTAGKPMELVKSDAMTCAPLKGGSGLAMDKNGVVFMAGSSANTLLRIGQDGKVETLVDNDGQLDFPASVALAAIHGERYAFITNRAASAAPKPGLLSYGPLL